MKPTPEFENKLCRVWKQNFPSCQPIKIWTRPEDSFFIPSHDIKVTYQQKNGATGTDLVKASEPWMLGCASHDSLSFESKDAQQIEVMIVELKENLKGTFPSIPMD